MRFDVFTTFPGMLTGPLSESIVKRAAARGIVEIVIHDVRDYAMDRHRTTDDYPYGGGAGMVMKPEPLFRAVEAVLGATSEARGETPIVLLGPAGRVLDQRLAEELARLPRLALLCGHYEGVDERVRTDLATDELSIGDYVLSAGEIAACVVIDCVTRLVPGAIDARSLDDESHTSGLLEYPHYTRPAEFRGLTVPDVLLSGHHAEIQRWRRERAIERTRERRPDLHSRWREADGEP